MTTPLHPAISIEAATLTDLRALHADWLEDRRRISSVVWFLGMCILISIIQIMLPSTISPLQHILTGFMFGVARPWNLARRRHVRALWTAQAVVLGKAATTAAFVLHPIDRRMVIEMQKTIDSINPMDRESYRSHLDNMIALVPLVSPRAAPWLAAHVALLAHGAPTPRHPLWDRFG